MKKILLVLLLAISATFVTVNLTSADDAGTADMIVHFQKWDGNYEGLGAHFWNAPSRTRLADDDFGAVFEFKGVSRASEVGFIAVEGITSEDGVFTPDWNKKHTQDVKIDASKLEKDAVNHVYVFEGAETKDGNPAYFIAKNDQANMLLVYADPSGSYEENLGIHNWNDWSIGNADWADPKKVFTNGASHGALPTIKVAMLHTNNVDAGFLIYAGGDDSKKTGDVTIKGALGLEGDAAVLTPGKVGVTYVYSKGNAYTANDNVIYNNQVKFVEEAFSFKILPMGVDDSGQFTGTYAPRPNQVMVELSAEVPSPLFKKVGDKNEKVTTDAEIKAANAVVKGWFTVNVKGGAALTIKQVDFSQTDETIKKFVVILEDNSTIDITKEYTVTFDQKLPVAAENKVDTIDVNIDKEKPVISFISPSDFATKEAADRIILVQWDAAFNRSLFPSFVATDDRDGEVTDLVYVVPTGDGYNSIIDTNKLGDYVITLRVEDVWGNVTEEAFTFRVQKKIK